MIGIFTTPTSAIMAPALSARLGSSIAACNDINPIYKKSRINSDVKRASHTHQAPHIGLPHHAPVQSARNVNMAPVGAIALATMEESRVLNARPIPAQKAMTKYKNIDIQAAGT